MFYSLPPVTDELSIDKQRSPRHKTAAQSNQLHSGPTEAANIQIEGNIPDESLGEVTKSTKDMFKYSQSVQVQDGAQSENSPLLPRLSVNRPPLYNSNSNNPNEESVTVQSNEGKPSFCQRIGRALRHLAWMISELLREEMVVLLAVLFVTMFSQTTTEVYVLLANKSIDSDDNDAISGYAGANDREPTRMGRVCKQHIFLCGWCGGRDT